MPWCLLGATATTPAARVQPPHHDLVEQTPERAGNVSASFREDVGRISILELDGDYDREPEGGALNAEARAAVAEAFLSAHEDAYDFLVAFTRFPWDGNGSQAFHWVVRNEVEGIGLPLFDQTDTFGSDGFLSGYTDMGRLADLGSEPGTPELERTLTILLHELFHQWAAYVRFDDGSGPSDALLGLDDAHWSFLLDTEASVLYGNRWRDNGDGTFTSTAIERVLSPLDLYLAGLLAPQEVPPFTLLANPAIDPDRLPELGATIPATPEGLTVDQIVAAEGARSPSSTEAPRRFQAAFLYLVRPGDPVSTEELAALERIRQALLVRFTAATGALATLEVHSAATAGGGGGPGTTGGGDPRTEPPSVTDAVTWLRDRQDADGSWRDVPSTRLRDTASALETLALLDPTFAGDDLAAALAWLAAETSPSTDHLAWQVGSLAAGGEPVAPLAAELLSRQNPDGGWGLQPALASDPTDTALALFALLGAGTGVAHPAVQSGVAYLLAAQNADGGWGPVAGGSSRIRAAVAALRVLAAAGETAAVDAGLQWLVGQQNADGGFGNSPSTAHETAEALETLAGLGALAMLPQAGAAAGAYLETRQDAAGSFEGSVFTTALAARALQRLSHPNWRFLAPPTAQPEAPLDGEEVLVTVEVVNDGSMAAPAGLVHLFDGDPSGGLLLDEAMVPPLDPGEAFLHELRWETIGAAGTHELVAALDPLDQVAELSETDNRATVQVVVEPAPAGVELALRQSDLVVTPAAPDRLPAQILVQSVLRNLGQSAATDVEVALSIGDPAQPTAELRTTVSVAPLSSAPVSFLWDLEAPGTTELRVIADPDDLVPEADEGNNEVAGSVSTVPSFDLEVLGGDLELLDPPAHVGEDLTFRARLRNRGTSDTPSFAVGLVVTDGVETRTLPPLQLQLAAGEVVVRDVVWRADLAGALTFAVTMDPANLVPEIDEANNAAALAFEATVPTEPNLTVAPADLLVDPEPALEGAAATLSALVRNTGGTAVGPFTVAFSDGPPGPGGTPIGTATVPALDAGTSLPVALVWDEVPDGADRFVHVVVDAEDAILELDESDNHAFRALGVLGLPDAAIGAGSLAFDPPLPAPGQPVTLVVDIANPGEQPLTDLVVRAWEGDPASGGVPVGGDQVVPSIPGQASGPAAFTWTLEATPGVRSIHVVVDPDGAVREADETNNAAVAALGVQNADAFVTERYFSPDGDGTRDATTLFFALAEPRDVEVRVVDRVREKLVRIFVGPELENVTSGQVTWDGRDGEGRLARDAEYELRIVSSQGTVEATALATLDTDRSSLLLAVGTEYELLTNLTCEVGGQYLGLRVPRSEDYAYFLAEDPSNPTYPKGIFRRALPFGALEEIVSPAWLGNRVVRGLEVAPQGHRIVFRLESDGQQQLWLANADGSGLTELPLDFNPVEPGESLGQPWVVGFGPGGDSVLVAGNWDFFAEYSLTEPGYPERWWPLYAFQQPADSTPDGRLHAFRHGYEGDVYLLDLTTSTLTLLVDASDYRSQVYPRWSPDGETLAVSAYEHGGVFLFDRNGASLGSVDLPTDGPFTFYGFLVPQWRGDGSEILVTGKHQSCRTVDRIDVAALTAENVLATCETWPPEGDGYDPGTELVEPPGDMIWDPNDRSVLRHAPWLPDDPVALFFDETSREEPFLADWSSSTFRFSPHGRSMVFWSDLTQADPEAGCRGGSDWWALTSLQNLTADLRVRLAPAGGYLLEGTAIDLHFDRYRLEWRELGGPGGWHPIAPPVETAVLDGWLGTWVPPGPGTYQVRLTASDLAGNRLSRLRQVSTSSTPDITDVVVAPPLFSPDGDGVLDELLIAYRVLRPVNLEIRIFDSADNLVRTFFQSHPAPGELVSLPWDGRDESGLRVPDGEYRVLVQQYEFFTAVDATPPAAAEPTLALVLSPPSPGTDRARLELSVTFAAQDAHLRSVGLERGAGAMPAEWEQQPAVCQGSTTERACEALVGVEEFTGSSFRGLADDHAGNRIVTLSPLAPEAVRVTGFGRHLTDPATGEPVPLEPTHQQGSFAFEHGPVRFAATEAVREELVQLFLQYRPSGGNEPWLELPVTELRDPATGETVPWIPQPRFELVWGLEELPPGDGWQLRLRAVDAAAGEHVTQALTLATDGLRFRGHVRPWAVPPPLAPLIAGAGLDPSASLLLWAEEWVAAPFEHATLYVTSDDDPRYETVRPFEPVAAAEGLLLWELADWQGCSTYTAWVEAVVQPAPGEPPRTLVTPAQQVRLPCLELSFEVEPVTSDGCGGGPDQTRAVTLRPASLDGSALQLLSLFGPDENGEEDLLYTVNQPASGAEYAFELDLADLPEGSHRLRAELTNIHGERVGGVPRSTLPGVAESGLVTVDRQPPSAAITYPLPGALVCPNSPTFPGVLDVEGEILDDRGAAHLLEWGWGPAPAEWHPSWIGGGEEPSPGALRHDVEGLLGPPGGLYSRSAAGRWSKELSIPSRGGVLGRVGEVSGEITVRLQAADGAGHHVCSASTTFTLDGVLSDASLAAGQTLFSPNGDGSLDSVAFTVGAGEPTVVDVVLYPGLMTAEGPLVTGPPSRVLADDLAIGTSTTLTWDGLDDGGQVVADGSYLAFADLVDACGNADQAVVQVDVDTLPPAVEIVSPTPSTPLPMIVTVTGRADDRHFFGWTLAWGEGPAPSGWFPLAADGQPVPEPAPLATWNTFGLSGVHTLRLRADDRAGNRAEATVTLDLEERTYLLDSLTADPAHFSPNADGRREETVIGFGLQLPSTITLAIVDDEEVEVARLLEEEALPQGPHSAPWDGGTAPDGSYRARVEARLTADPTVVQIEETPVVLDRTAPTVAIDHPQDGGWTASTDPVHGTIADEHLDSWSVAIASPPGSGQWQELATGSQPLSDAPLAGLGGLAEGLYSLRVLAEDRGETRSELLRDFGVDDTPPVAVLTAPAPGAFVGGPASPVVVEGEAGDEHLNAWLLELGSGSPPAWISLTSSDEAASGTLLTWDATAAPEGPATLRLGVRDLAGNESAAELPLVVDNTPPVAQIDSPASGAFVATATSVVGTADDVNLAAYALEVLDPSGLVVSLLAAGEEPVAGGVLGEWASLPPDGDYELRLSVRDRVDHLTEVSVPVTVDTLPPAPPTGLAAELVGGDDALLTWNATGEPDLAGYRVFRDGSPLVTDPVAATSWLDPDLPPGTYAYTVTAVDQGGLESAPAGPVTVSLDTTPPLAEIHAPLPGEAVAGLVDVLGTAWSADDFALYRVLAAPAGGPPGLVHESTVPVQAALLAQWDTGGLPEGAAYGLRLEAEDLAGNVAVVETAVVVDNAAPAAPTGLAAAVAGPDVHLSWNANAEPDLLGYLLYRDDRLVNANGPVLGDLRPYALTSTHYDDLALPDGAHEYVLYAIDQAGNTSPPSAPATAVVETGPPAAILVHPVDGSSFEDPVYLLAEVDAEDVATVRFQHRASGEPGWLDLGVPDPAAPFDAILDPTATAPPLTHGPYDLRAVATDTSGNEDPDPAVISVAYADLTPPDPPSGLAATVAGGAVTLAWSAAGAPDLEGYLVYRADGAGAETQVTPAPIADTTLVDSDLPDDDYSYEVTAVDLAGNESDRTPPAAASVYTPRVTQPLTPRLEATVDLVGTARPDTLLSGELSNDAGTFALPEVPADAEGRFALPGLALAPGRNEIRLRATDGAGNVSKEAFVPLDVGSPPTPPTGLAADVAGLDVTLSWNPNPEPAILGYRPHRGGLPLLLDELATGLVATASSETQPASRAVDGDPATAWWPSWPPEGDWIEVAWGGPEIVTTVALDWYSPSPGQAYSAENLRLETWSGEVWVPLLELAGNQAPGNLLVLPRPYRTDRLRIVLGPTGTVALAELRVEHRPVISATAFLDQPGDGTHEYSVTAVDELAFESQPSDTVEVAVGDVEPPEPVALAAQVLGSDVELTWTASASPDVVAYEIARDGEVVALHADLGSLLFLDPGLLNGAYTYLVRAVDAAGNRSADSNPAVAVVAVPLLEPPQDLEATPLPAGRRVLLEWSPGPGAPATAYRLLHSLASGGPWETVTTTSSTAFEDDDLDNGVPYYWIVLALDAVGNASPPSNEATATPFDAEAPPAPTLHHPTIGGRPVVVATASTPLAAAAEPGAAVTFRRDGEAIGVGAALATDELVWGAGLDGPELRLAPDGSRLWGTIWDEAMGEWSWRLVGFDGAPAEIVDRHADRARWSRDGRELVYAEGGRVHAWDVEHRSERLLATADEVRTAEPSPDGGALAVVGSRGSPNLRLWHVLLDGEVWTDVQSASSTTRVEWSPDGLRFAFDDSGWKLYEVATGTLTALPPDVSGSPAWSPDGSRLLLPRTVAGEAQVWVWEPATGELVQLTADPDGAAWPRWAPDGSAFAYLAGGTRLVLAAPTGEVVRTLVELAATCAPCDLQWVGGGALFAYTRGGLEWLRLVPEGTATLPAAPLLPGENRFRATATDAAGNESAESGEIVVVRSAAGLPDLALASGDLQVIPAGPFAGSTALFSVTLRNTGDAPATGVEVSALLLAPDGSSIQLLQNHGLDDIEPGGAATATVEQALPGPPGVYRLIATADPRDLLAEAEEGNNLASRDFPVVPSAEPALSVATDRPAYGAFEVVHAEAVLLHGGPAFDGELVLRIVDLAGVPLAVLLQETVHLEAGDILELPATWSTGQTWAGPYRLAGELTDAGGVARATATADFEILETFDVEVAVGAGQPLYQAGDPVQVLADVSYLEGNTLLDGCIVDVRLEDPAGLLLETFSTALGALLPGDAVHVASWWNSQGHPGGEYRLELTLTRSGLLLGAAAATFVLEAPTVEVLGDLALSNPTPPVGEPVAAAFEVLNLGTEPLLGVPLRLRLLEPVSGVTLALEELVADLPPGVPVAGSVVLPTAGLEPIPHVVLLQAELDDGSGTATEVNLAVETLLPVDGAAPVLAILRPQEGELLGLASLSAVLEASDPTGPLAAVECRLDGGAWVGAVPLDPAAGTYSCDLSALVEGAHVLEARARDETGNTATAGPVAFTLDLTPPAVEVLGVVDGGLYAEPVTPEIVVTEAHPGTETVLLDGAPFASGTTIDAPGAHLLEVVAEDAAGNRSELAVHFTLLPGGPLELTVNTVNDVDDGHCGPQHCSLREAIREANRDSSPAIVRFDIPGPGTLRRIRPLSPLPAVTASLTLDGLSQAGAACDGPPEPAVILDGSALTPPADGLLVTTTDSAVLGLGVVGFPGVGIRLAGGGGHLVECSRVGDLDGQGPGAGNAGDGILLEAGAADSRIGSAGCPAPCNVIAFNGGAGIALAPTAAGGIEIRGNGIRRNGGLAVDLGADGLTLNDDLDADAGPNALQNYPEVLAVRPGETSEVDVALRSTPESDFAIELFRVDVINGDPQGARTPPPFGEADDLLAQAQLATDADGSGTVTLQVPVDLSTTAVTATATDLATGDTSELGAAFVAHFTHSIVAGLRAVADGHGRGFVEWRTASESGVLGFRLFRLGPTLAAAAGEWTELTEGPVLALHDSPEGALYRVAIEPIEPAERLHLLLVEEGTRGNRRLYGPFLVPVSAASPGDGEVPPPAPRREPLARPPEASPDPPPTAAQGGGGVPVVKIGVRESGLHRLGAAELAAALGLDETAVRAMLAAREGRLEVAGAPVDWLAEADASALYFWGEAPTDPYSPVNVYWLELGPITDPSTYSGLAPPPEPGGHFPSMARFAEDAIAATNLALDPDEDFWFWKAVVATAAGSETIPFELASPAPPGTGTAELRLGLYAPPAPGAAEQRTVVARVNGSLVGQVEWQGWGWAEASFAFPDSLLAAGPNELELAAVAPPGAPLAFFYLDALSVTYPRQLRADGGSLLVTGATASTLTVEALPTPEPWVLDVSGERSLARVVDVTVTGRGPWAASWVPATGADRFWVGDPPVASLVPEWVVAEEPSRLLDGRNAADLLVLSTPPLLAALEPLLAQREAEGLLVARVDVQDVYDELNYGLASPRALEAFLEHVAAAWSVAPRYVLLAGAGTFDYRDHLGAGGNPVPPLLARTADGLFSTDLALGDVGGDGLPELVVGRIPARDPQEMGAYVDKVLAWESGGGASADRLLLVADAGDGVADFGADTLALLETIPTGETTALLGDELGLPEIRQQLVAALETGTGLVHYLGHGGVGQLGQQPILATSDVEALANAPALPVVVAPTCVANRHELPTAVSLGEALVLEPDGGAVAVLSASGLSQHGAALRLSQAWLERPWPDPAGRRLGDLVLEALEEAAVAGAPPDAFRTYTLLGDPTLRAPQPPP